MFLSDIKTLINISFFCFFFFMNYLKYEFFKIFNRGLEATIKAKIGQELTQVAVGKQFKP